MSGPIPNSPCLPAAALTEFSQEMLLALRAGLPVGDVVAALALQARSRSLRRALGRVREAMRGGCGLADALAAQGGAFPASWVSQIGLAERGGFMSDTFQNHWNECRRDERLRAAVRATAAYPLAIFWATAAVLAVMALLLLPRALQFVVANGIPIPGLTRAALRGTAWVHAYRVLVVVAAAWCLWWQTRVLFCASLRWPGWQTLGRISPFTEYFRQANAATFLTTAGFWHLRGLADGQVLDLAGEVVAGAEARRAVASARQAIEEGCTLGDAVGRLGFLPAETHVYLRSLPPGPALAQAMADHASLCEERTAGTSRRMPLVVEPVMMVLVGLALSLALTAFYAPLFVRMKR